MIAANKSPSVLHTASNGDKTITDKVEKPLGLPVVLAGAALYSSCALGFSARPELLSRM